MSDWPAGSRVFLDTAPVIYFVEAHPRYAPVLDSLFDHADRGLVEVVVSSVTVAECLVGAWRRGEP